MYLLIFILAGDRARYKVHGDQCEGFNQCGGCFLHPGTRYQVKDGPQNGGLPLVKFE